MTATRCRARVVACVVAVLAVAGRCVHRQAKTEEEGGPPTPAFLGHESDRVSAERRRAIEASREELDRLAKRVAHGDLKDVAELDRVFAHARAALVR
jgi:hypothetical protein